MKLRKALAAVAGGIGLAAVSNRVLAARAGELGPALPVGSPRTYRWRGFDVGYTEAGDPEDPDLVLFHGINAAGSSHEFRPVVEDLSERYHVLAPDLPGFGHSDRPPLLYSASLYETFVADFLDDLADDDATVVGSGLSGAYVGLAARETPTGELILICPTDDTMGDRTVWLRSLLRSPLVGELLFNAVVSERSMRYFHADHGYYDMDNLDEETLDYEWQTGHQEGARFAPASFVSGFLDPEESLATALAGLDVPVTMVWGREAEVTPLENYGRDLADAANARLIVFDESLLLPHAEHPEQFVSVVDGEFEPDESAATPGAESDFEFDAAPGE